MNEHLFIVPPNVWAASNEDEIAATCVGLQEMGLFRLPYDRGVYVQIPANEVCRAPGGITIPARDCPSIFLVGPMTNDLTEEPTVMVRNLQTGWSINLTASDDVTEATRTSAKGAAGVARMLLIVLLATRNVVKTTKANKLAKLGIGRKNPNSRFAYVTTITLPAELEDDDEHRPTGTSKMPHLRRGHIRRQHYGPANGYIKKIWVPPVFVNADPDFVSTRKAYNVAVPAP